MQAVLSILLATFAGFGVVMSGSSILVEILRLRRRWQASQEQQLMTQAVQQPRTVNTPRSTASNHSQPVVQNQQETNHSWVVVFVDSLDKLGTSAGWFSFRSWKNLLCIGIREFKLYCYTSTRNFIVQLIVSFAMKFLFVYLYWTYISQYVQARRLLVFFFFFVASGEVQWFCF